MNNLTAAIKSCFECAQVCTGCADACLAEENVSDLRKCIRTDQDCADICIATGKVLSRLTGLNTDVVKAQLMACITAVRVCAEECEQHADHHDHCRICAETCRRCERACSELLASMAG